MFNRKVHWESIHDGKSPLDVSWYQKEPSSSLELIRNTQVSDGEPIIDVGGGTSLLVDFLIEEGHSNIAVLDISQKALAYTQKRLGDLAQSVEWFETDITGFEAPHHFSLWHDRAVFHRLAVGDRDLLTDDRRHETDRLPLQGPDLLSLPGLLSPDLGEPGLPERPFPAYLPTKPETQGSRQLGNLAAGLPGPLPACSR